MRELKMEEFSGREGQSFELLSGERRYELTLEKVQPLPASMPGRDAFVLEWLGPYEPVLEQAIYTFRRDDEEYEIFICPKGRDRSGVQYEAVFN